MEGGGKMEEKYAVEMGKGSISKEKIVRKVRDTE